MSALERRSRMLLLAYPAAYRRERGDEIVETLLIATPPGRDWPLSRDVLALIIGGARVRADFIRLRSSGAREASAALAGVAAYLCLLVARNLTSPLRWLMAPTDPALHSSAWLLLIAQLGVAAAMVLAWCCRRRTVVMAGAVAAALAVWLQRPWPGYGWGSAAAELACLAAVMALSAGDRPDRRWLWPIGLLLVVQVLAHPQIERALTRILGLPQHAGSAGPLIRTAALVGIAVATVTWIGIEVMSATIALAAFLLSAWLAAATAGLSYVSGVSGFVTLSVVLGAIAVLSVWRLRRQSAH